MYAEFFRFLSLLDFLAGNVVNVVSDLVISFRIHDYKLDLPLLDGQSRLLKSFCTIIV